MAALTEIREEFVKNPTSRRSWRIAAVVLFACLAGSLITNAFAQGQGEEKISDLPRYAPGTLFQPASNFLLAVDLGKRVHSNLRILVPPANRQAKLQLTVGDPLPGISMKRLRLWHASTI